MEKINELLDAALAYAEAGIPVFPLAPGTKFPAIPKAKKEGEKGGKGVLDATTDEATIRAWWEVWPRANIGIPMGRASNLIGIDIDFKDGCDPNFPSRLPPTVRTISPNGGLHAFFKWPEKGIKNGLKLEKGATVRGEGYYFVAPPSVLSDGKKYVADGEKYLYDNSSEETPQWIEEFNEKEIEERKPLIVPEVVGRGTQNATFWALACSLRSKGLDEPEIYAGLFALNERSVPRVPENELHDFAHRACKYPKGINTKVAASAAPTFIEEEHVEEPDEPEIPRHFPLEYVPEIVRAPIPMLAELISVPIEIVASSLFAAMAVAVQEFYNIEMFGGIKPISLYFITVAESGERKSTVDNKALEAHKAWAREKFAIYEKEQKAYKKDLAEWKSVKATGGHKAQPSAPKAPTLFVSEPTIEGLFQCLKSHRSSAGLFADEGGAFLGGYSMKAENIKGTLGKLNQLWDGSPIDRIRKGKDDTEIDVLYDKRVSSHLMVQPKIAHELFSNEYAKSQGFLARCLTVFPKSKIGKRSFSFSIPTPKEMEPFNERVLHYLNKTKPGASRILPVTPSAVALVKDFYDEIEKQLEAGQKYASVRDFASKLMEHCVRLAAVFEVFANPEAQEISESTMRGAIEIGRFYLEEQMRVTSKSVLYSSPEAQRLHEFLTSRDKWELREVLQRVSPKKLRKKSLLLELIKELEHDGYCHYNEHLKQITL